MNKTLWAYRNKITNKLWKTVHVPAQGRKKGDVLLSYQTSSFTQTPKEIHSDPHASYWECKEIARLFSERGYGVDVIEWNNAAFKPRKNYIACIDTQKNLESLAPHLPKACKKVMHVVSSHADFQNSAEQQRLKDLEARSGIKLMARRVESPTKNPLIADYMEGFGNKTVHATYAFAGKEIFPVHESVSKTFDFPENKDFSRAKKAFLWFGGGGALHKGLDIALEAFRDLPELTLHIVGPVAAEKDFMEAYKTELALPNIVLHDRPKTDLKGNMTVDGKPFSDIADACGALLYLSCSEGTSGAAVQAIHAGLFPIMTPETGIDESCPAFILEKPTVENVTDAVEQFAALPDSEAKKMAFDAWTFVRGFYSKEAFSRTYAAFIDNVLKL